MYLFLLFLYLLCGPYLLDLGGAHALPAIGDNTMTSECTLCHVWVLGEHVAMNVIGELRVVIILFLSSLLLFLSLLLLCLE